MSQAFILCPETRNYAYVGLNLEWTEAEVLQIGEQEIVCPHCGKAHLWTADELILRSDGGGD